MASAAAAALLSGLTLSPALAEPQPYTVTTWRTRDGLPLDTVRALLQTSDHYLWIATPNGLARFDGSRFVVFEAATTENLPNNLVTAMHEDAEGTLWLGLETGEVVRHRDGGFLVLPRLEHWRFTSITRFVDGSPGQLFALNLYGAILEVTNGHPARVIKRDLSRRVLNLIQDADGVVWAQEPDGFRVLQEGHLIPGPDAPPAGLSPWFAFPARHGGVWVLDRERLRRWRQGRWVEDRGASPPVLSAVPIAMETSEGRILNGSFRQGLYISETDGTLTRLGVEHGLGSDWVNCVAEDHEGGMWVGTSGGGLSRIQPGSLQSLTVGGNLPECSLLSVSPQSNGDLWFGSEGEGVLRLRQQTWERWSETAGLAHPSVRAVHCDPDGRVWAGTWGGGLYVLQSNRFSPAPGWTRHQDDVMCLYEDPQGTLYAGTRIGLMRQQSNSWDFVKHQGSNVFADVRSIAADARKALWIGTAGAGLWRLHEDQLIRYGRSDGLRSDNIWSLLPDMDDPDTLWVGTQGGGLVRMRQGRIASITRNQGLPGNTITGMAEDEGGHLWLATYDGIACVRKSDLHRCADGPSALLPARVFDAPDGLVSRSFPAGIQPTVGRTPDGRLWFATAKGVVALDPARALARVHPAPPRVRIESVLANDSALRWHDEASPLPLGPGLQRLEIHYGAVTFITPERVRFRYRLRGLEADWVNAEGRRTVHYSHLPPGSFVFEVRACNGDGEWSDTPTTLAFTVQPFLWQRRPFQWAALFMAATMVMGLTYAVARSRQRRKLAALRQQHAVERERARIAHDIPDDLGANLTRISMLSDMAASGPGLAPETGAMVTQIADCARSSVSSLDEIVWAVNPRHDTLQALLDYLSHYGHTFLEETDISLDLDFPNTPPPDRITSETRYSILMIVKEALNNVVRHAGARTVRILARVEAGQLQLVIKDDGKGFPPPPAQPAGGNGLISMRQRAERFGGSLIVDSHPQQGTCVRLELPLPLQA